MVSSTKVEKSFLGKAFYFHLRRESHVGKADELIKLFGGKIEQFLDCKVSYVLTDIPKADWPPDGNDATLKRAYDNKIKILSYFNLVTWCHNYLASQSGNSDEDDDAKANVNQLREPYIKFEDISCRFAPTAKEFVKWPEINVTSNLPLGKSIFNDSNLLSTPTQSLNNVNHPNNSAQLTQQAAMNQVATNNTANTNTHNNTVNNNNGPKTPANHRAGKRKPPVYCEICNTRIHERIDDHILTQAHTSNLDKFNWSEVTSVIASLPGLGAFNPRRIAPPRPCERQEFVPLHKIESISQLFSS